MLKLLSSRASHAASAGQFELSQQRWRVAKEVTAIVEQSSRAFNPPTPTSPELFGSGSSHTAVAIHRSRSSVVGKMLHEIKQS